MNGLTRILMGFFWIGCTIYGYNHVSPDFTTGGVFLAGIAIVIIGIVGVALIINGIEKFQRGE